MKYSEQRKTISDSDLYIFNNEKVELYSSFIYEICIYNIYKWGSSLYGYKILNSKNYIQPKKSIIKKYKDYTKMIEISILAVTVDFAKENKLEKFVKKHEKAKKSSKA